MHTFIPLLALYLATEHNFSVGFIFLLFLVKNYKSCKDSDGPPLTDPEAQYQVLNMGTRNRVLFPNYNGMYVFRVIVVDPSYRSVWTRRINNLFQEGI